MNHLLLRAYARQRLASYRRDMLRRNREIVRDALWVILCWAVASGLLISGCIG